MQQFLLLCLFSTATALSPFSPQRVKRQYESEIVAISPKGKWTSVYHQPLDAIREKGLPLLEHHGALRDVQAYPATGPSPYPFPGFGLNPYLNTVASASYLPNNYGGQTPRLLLIVPPGTNLPSAASAPLPYTPVAAAAV